MMLMGVALHVGSFEWCVFGWYKFSCRAELLTNCWDIGPATPISIFHKCLFQRVQFSLIRLDWKSTWALCSIAGSNFSASYWSLRLLSAFPLSNPIQHVPPDARTHIYNSRLKLKHFIKRPNHPWLSNIGSHIFLALDALQPGQDDHQLRSAWLCRQLAAWAAVEVPGVSASHCWLILRLGDVRCIHFLQFSIA